MICVSQCVLAFSRMDATFCILSCLSLFFYCDLQYRPITNCLHLPFHICFYRTSTNYTDIVLLSLKGRSGYSRVDFISAMKEVIIPVTMTSVVNGSMFAIMTLVKIPAVYKTAQMALISVVFLYLTILFCFPAYCWLDFKRQAAGRTDILFCLKSSESNDSDDPEGNDTSGRANKEAGKTTESLLYTKIYYPLVLGDSCIRHVAHAIIWVGAIALLGVGIWGITTRNVGLGLEVGLLYRSCETQANCRKLLSSKVGVTSFW